MVLGWFSEDEYDVFHVCTTCRYRRFNLDTLKVMTLTDILLEHSGLRLCEICSNKWFTSWAYGPCYPTTTESEVRISITQYGLLRSPLR